MKTYAPSYYKDFSCIADKCQHSCCIGWEIDIDERTDELYKTVDGKLGERLKKNIDRSGEASHFTLSSGERCPFLNKNGLCDIISELGEGALCQICADHPRFRNFYSDRTEIGLGLCCEAATELILNSTDKMTLNVISCDGESDECDECDELFFSLRDKIFSIIQNREESIEKRILRLLSEFDLAMPNKTVSEWADIFLSLEMLDGEWGVLLNKLKTSGVEISYENEIACEQLLSYFIYRHLADGLYDGKTEERIKLAILGLNMITAVAKASGISFAEASRFYSSEIEYSEENVDELLSKL